MYKRLRIYYFYTALPFLLLLGGGAVFSGAIMRTLSGNPHPQINYAIFAVTLTGGLLILRGVHQVMKEVRALDRFSSQLKEGTDPTVIAAEVHNLELEIGYVLRMVAATVGRALSHQEQSAIEHELGSAQKRLEARHALPQFLTSLLVGLGLLGTFVGLLSALSDIGAMVASFASLDVNSADLIGVFRNMVDSLKAPMASMAIAFSASMFGLLGSIILGFMMVSARGLVRELHSFLGSEVSQHLNLALAKMGPATLAKVVENMSEVLNSSIDRLTRELEVSFSQLSSSLAGVDNKVKNILDDSIAMANSDHPLRQVLTEQSAVLARIDSQFAANAEVQRNTFENLASSNSTLAEGLQQGVAATLERIVAQIAETQAVILRNSQDLNATLNSGALSVKLGEGPDSLDRLPDMLSKVSNAVTMAASRMELASRSLAEKGPGGPQIIGASEGVVAVGGGPSKELLNEQIDLLRRIEERLAENYRTQSTALSAEFENMSKTRGEMTRVFGEHAESMAMLRSELQRIGRQFGVAQSFMERSGASLTELVSEGFATQNNAALRHGEQMASIGDAMTRLAEDSAQNVRVLGEILERTRVPETRGLINEVIGAIRQVASLQIDLGMKIEQAQMDSADQMRELIRTEKEAVKLLAVPGEGGKRDAEPVAVE
jgi:hypothetical protein